MLATERMRHLAGHRPVPAQTQLGARPGQAAASARLARAIGNRAMSELVARSRATAGASTPPLPTSPPNLRRPDQAEIADGIDLTTPGDEGSTLTGPDPDDDLDKPGQGAGSRASYPVEVPDKLEIKTTGSIEGSYGISNYWPVTTYWGEDKTLGQFDEAVSGSSGWRMIGHKFQVVGTTTTGSTRRRTGGQVTFKQEARITSTKGGKAGPWFDDMNYTDSGGAKHAWDPNTEAGSTSAGGNPGVRRTISTGKYAYTDPPAVGYTTTTNTYRKLEFRIHLIPAPDSDGSEIIKTATQEIEVVDGKPKILQWP